MLEENEHLPSDDGPDIAASDEWLWRCFMRLTHDRPQHPVGMGAPIPGRIPWLLLRHWSEAEGYTDEQFEYLEFCIGEMDLEFLDHEVKKRQT